MKALRFKNFKSLVNVEIEKPQPFTVFVGPNASGKSNIFQAIEFLAYSEISSSHEAFRHFGGADLFTRKKNYPAIDFQLNVDFDFGNDYDPKISISFYGNSKTAEPWFSVSPLTNRASEPESSYGGARIISETNYKQFILNHSRIFINSNEAVSYNDSLKLSAACGNLPKVLKRLLEDDDKREEITDWLRLLIPGFENLEIRSEPLSKTDNLLIYEKGNSKPFPGSLISNGTFNIIAIIAAVFQSNQPQFLCIEEPENGLNPKVIKELVGFFRDQCKEKGHYIWLNTHSQTLVRELTPDEIILVDKVNGETKIKQIQGMNLHGLKMDEALLSNAIGGGIPW